jgi:murein DD-endopeptidase MepM/ murein hydrolase activator NlpD
MWVRGRLYAGLVAITLVAATSAPRLVAVQVVTQPVVVAVPHPIAPSPEITHGLVAHVVLDGKPVANAEVAIADGTGPVLATAKSGRDGIVRFTDMAAGPHELWASSEGAASAVARVSEEDASIELALVPAAAVKIHVVAEPPLATGGSVQLTPVELDQSVRTAQIGERGEVAIAGLPFGRWRVEASVPGYVQTGEQVVKIGDAKTLLDLHLVRAGTVTGTVVDGEGQPVANATIVLAEQTSAVPPQRPLDLVATGLRWVHPLAGARWLPVIDDARFGANRPGPRPAECGRGHCGLDIGSERGSIVHAAADGEIVSLFPDAKTEAGKVVVIHHGRGLKSFYMHLDEIRPGLEVGQAIRAGDPVGTLGSTGFSRPLPHLHFAITYEAGGHTWYLDPEPIIRQAVVLAKSRPYEPVDAAAPAKKELTAAPQLVRVTTDAQGVFKVEGVAPGTYAAGAFAPDFAPGSSNPFIVKTDEETPGIVVTLNAGVLVEGRVVGRDGPIEGATLMASAGFGETAHKVAMTTTDRHGEFTLRALGGKVTLLVSAPRYGDTERAISLDTADTRRGRHREDFSLMTEDGQLRGQVFAPEGGAAAGVTVRVIEGLTHRSAHTDAQGQFVIAPVATGHYVLEVSGGEAPAKRVGVDSDRWSEVRLDAGGGVHVIVRDAQTAAPLANARVDLVGPMATLVRATDAHGVLDLRGMAAGDWKIVARAPGYAVAAQTLTIRVSRLSADVALDLSRGAIVEGVVRDRYGRRVPGARVSVGAASAVADRDGNFHLADVPSGAVVLEAEADGKRGQLPLQLAPGDSRMSVDVELPDR